MAISLTHTTVAVGTDAGNGEIGKAQWNEAHTLTMATGNLLGRSTSGTGAAEEIAIGTGLDLTGGTLSLTVTATPGGSDTQVQFNDGGSFGGDAGLTFNKTTGRLTLGTSGQAAFSTDLLLTRKAAANLRFGAADAAAPVAQTLSVQSVVAGTTNTAGANLTITGSQGTGTGVGGSIIFQVAPAGSSGTAQNALVNLLEVTSTRRFSLYNTFTDATTFERANIFWDSNVLKIGTEKGSVGGTARALEFQTDGTTRLTIAAAANTFSFNNSTLVQVGGISTFGFIANQFQLASATYLGWAAAPNSSGNATLRLYGNIDGVAVRGNSTTAGAHVNLTEMTAPAAPAANGVNIYAEDDGAGKTRLMALFASGAAQQIAIEP
jgi:hypothetical protein